MAFHLHDAGAHCDEVHRAVAEHERLEVLRRPGKVVAEIASSVQSLLADHVVE